MNRPLPFVLWAVVIGLALAFFGGAARGQAGGGGGSGNTGPVTGAGTNEVTIIVRQFGVGKRWRPGDYAGVQVELTDKGAAPARDVILRMELADADGDIMQQQAVLTLNSGKSQSEWLYPRLPLSVGDPATFTFSVYAADGTAGLGAAEAKTGELIGRVKVQVQQLVAPYDGMMAVVGRSLLQLDLYAQRPSGMTDAAPMGNERSELVTGLRTADLPDRWMGYSSFDTIVWTGNTGDGADPGELSAGQADALSEWVTRGGHLVLVMPSVGQTWTNPTNPLAAIMPRVAVERHEGVDMTPYRPLLTREVRAPFPAKGVVNLLPPAADAGPTEAMCILAGINREPVVVRRVVGSGAVTLIGLDLTAKPFMNAAVLEPEVFWNRVLGKRASQPTAQQVTLLAMPKSPQDPLRGYFDMRNPVVVDAGIKGEISQTAKAAAGVLLGFVVFLVYWLVAGPVTFAVLKARGKSHHSWVAFVIAVGLFTALAWGGANAIKPRHTHGQQLTILDHVYGQPTERARSWMSVLLPSYGQMKLDIERDGPTDKMHNAITSWDPPVETGGERTVFPDRREYAVDSRWPDALMAPTRSTVKTVQMDWCGGGRWRMPMPIAGEDGAIVLKELDLPVKPSKYWTLSGKLTHELPGTLTNVDVFVVRGFMDINTGNNQLARDRRQGSGAGILMNFDAFHLSGGWAPKEVLDLSQVTATVADGQGYLNGIVNVNQGESYNRFDVESVKVRDWLRAVTFFDMLQTPNWGQEGSHGLPRREVTHGYDLSRWFTQPCVIIVGELVNVDGPIPLRVDGEKIPTPGRTLVRWVYPLPANPPTIDVTKATSPANGGGADGAEGGGNGNVPGDGQPANPGT